MKIAIDLNDVVRDFSANFLKCYIEGYNRAFDLEDFEFWDVDMSVVFPFSSERSYHDFIYNNYAFNLYGRCGCCSSSLTSDLNEWTEKTIKELKSDESVDIMFVSTKEYGLSIASTYYFISKLGSKVREVFMPSVSSEIWDRCDVLITANPNLLGMKPEGKISVKIEQEYNKESESDYTYKSFKSFLKDVENTEKLFKKE